MRTRRYHLEKMDGLMLGMTVFLIIFTGALCVGPFIIALLPFLSTPHGAEVNGDAVMAAALGSIMTGGTGIFIALLLVSIVLFFRPRYFELSSNGLSISWWTRGDVVPRGDLCGAELMSKSEFRARFGWGYRFGAGGFLGGFGRFHTSKTNFRLYISRVDQYVIVTTHGSLPLMITPERPEEFVETVNQLASNRPLPSH
jgi:hypothetical protein